MSQDLLTYKTLKGASWSFLDNVANQGITFLIGLLLARLLSPDEYGLIGIITIFIVIFTSIVDSGLTNALIKKKNPSDKDYNTVYITNIGLSALMFVALFFLAKPISSFFKRPELVPLAQTMGVILIINATSAVHKTILSKRIDFKTQTKVSLIASLLSGAIGIIMAFCGLGVWSLVGQQIFRSLLQSFFTIMWSNWRPKLFFSFVSFRELFSYGWKLMAAGIINSLWNEAYQVVIGKFYSSYILGQYTRSKQFADIFSTNLTSVVQRVSFPALSEIQDEDVRLKEAYRCTIRTVMLVSFSLLFGLVSISDNFVYVLLGDQWDEAAKFLPVICLQCVFYPLCAINLNILMVKGRSDIYLYLEIFKRIMAIVPLALGVFKGIYWMLWASVVYSVVAYVLNAYFSGREIKYSLLEQFKDLAPSFLISILMAMCIGLLNFINFSPYIILVIQILTGCSISCLLFELTNNRDFILLKNTILSLLLRGK